MSDWEFLYEMRGRGYDAEEIADAAGCGMAPWENQHIESQEIKAECGSLVNLQGTQKITVEISNERKDRPSKEQVAQLPPFDGLTLDRIFVVKNLSQLKAASAAIHAERFVGFDTESKPTWSKDEPRTGPHIIQFALSDRAYIVQVPLGVLAEPLRAIIESENIVKIGFGLNSDRGPLFRNLGFRLKTTVELSHSLRALRYKQRLGVNAAVAIVLGKNLHKPKSITTSNWALPKLSARQLEYAANDAFAALKVFRAIGSPYASAYPVL
ncbi:3'-5' exonuclease [Zoogloea sp.]|uniref:3'-5' exonuclease n=1 Tax=Zoogloea sp. TaxID=49181 RepID=UPI00261A5EBC|nr:3'-5' exonuclease [Zoogloea sp.]